MNQTRVTKTKQMNVRRVRFSKAGKKTDEVGTCGDSERHNSILYLNGGGTTVGVGYKLGENSIGKAWARNVTRYASLS